MFARLPGRALADDRGNAAMVFALALPALAVLSIGAVEIASLTTDRARMQDVADAAALAGAQELSVGVSQGVTQRAEAFARQRLTDLAARGSVQTEARLSDGRSVIEVSVTSNRPSFFGSLLPPGGFTTTVRSRAAGVGETPICVIALSRSTGKVINLQDSAEIAAAGCLLQSNDDVEVEGQGRIAAGAVHASGTARGAINPAAMTGAPPLDDPFAAQSPPMGSCGEDEDGSASVVITRNTTLQAGVHCGSVQIENGAIVTLAPGEHVFRDGDLQVKGSSRLVGTDVVMAFALGAKFQFQDTARVDLVGRRTGPYAGMVLVAARENTSDFVVSSNNVDRLEGVIYMPASRLIVEGDRNIAEQSNWTVTVTRELQVKGSPVLVINSDYAASDVPVPEGVGPRNGGVRLTR